MYIQCIKCSASVDVMKMVSVGVRKIGNAGKPREMSSK